jgi:formyl-CoA transferase/CoA:oxalate CoA-transferase
MGKSKKKYLALKKIKVVDFTHAWAGPACSMLLADMGADVIKVEALSGDFYRVSMDGSLFVSINRNKRSIALNIKTKQGYSIITRMLSNADVLVENFSPGTMQKMGLDYEEVSKLNPTIIYCSISGFGQEGPYRERRGYDPVAQAMSGIMIATGEPNRPPVRILPAMIDYGAGIHAAYGIVTCLLARKETNRGERIDVSLFDVGINQMAPHITHFSRTGEMPARAGSGHIAWAPYQAFETKDGYVHIAVTTEKMWKQFCEALHLDHLWNNVRYSTFKKRVMHKNELAEELGRVTKKYDSDTLEKRLLEAGIPCGKLMNIGEVVEDPHVKMRGLVKDISYFDMGKIKIVETPILFSNGYPETRLKPPLLGQHTTEILREMGYNEQEIRKFIDEGIAKQSEQ